MQNDSFMIGTHFLLREEKNGLIVYKKKEHRYFYYDGLTIDDVKSKVPSLSIEDINSFFEKEKNRIVPNVQVESPLYIGWQLSENCNMDCIYCFADTKLHDGNTDDIMNVVQSILDVNPVCVGLSGGEPTLNKRLPDIIKLFKGKVSCILNTNGTTPILKDLVPLLKESGILVRISIDSTVNRIQNEQRPLKAHRDSDYDQLSIIKESVRSLLDAEVPLEIHTVVTQKNKPYLDQTCQDLIEMGVSHWHLYKLNCCPKCADIFDSLSADDNEIQEVLEYLKKKYGDRILITAGYKSKNNRARSVILVDSNGRFWVQDKNNTEIIYIGKDPKRPTIDEIHNTTNWDDHLACYLVNLNNSL